MTKPDSDTLERMQQRKSLERINRRRRRCGQDEHGGGETEPAKEDTEKHDLEVNQSFHFSAEKIRVSMQARVAWTIVLTGAATGLIWLLFQSG